MQRGAAVTVPPGPTCCGKMLRATPTWARPPVFA